MLPDVVGGVLGSMQSLSFAFCLVFSISSRKIMTPTLKNMGSQALCFCGLAGCAGLHRPIEQSSPGSCPASMARSRGSLTF